MTMRTRYVYVRFGVSGRNALGLHYSIEPRKWNYLLSIGLRPDSVNVRHPIEAYGYSEWPTSLNILITLDQDQLETELRQLKDAFTGAVDVGLFEPIAVTPPLVERFPAQLAA